MSERLTAAELDEAESRLTAWVRDFGHLKEKPFISDLQVMLRAVAERRALLAELTALRRVEVAARAYRHGHWLDCEQRRVCGDPCQGVSVGEDAVMALGDGMPWRCFCGQDALDAALAAVPAGEVKP